MNWESASNFREIFPVSVFLVFHLDDDNGRQTDRQEISRSFLHSGQHNIRRAIRPLLRMPWHDMPRNSFSFCATASANRLQLYHRIKGK